MKTQRPGDEVARMNGIALSMCMTACGALVFALWMWGVV